MPVSRKLFLYGCRIRGEQLKDRAGEVGVEGKVPAYIFLRILRKNLLSADGKALSPCKRTAYLQFILGEHKLDSLWQECRIATLRQLDPDVDVVILGDGELNGFGQ
ncbi:hypothetical protein D3C85_880360 [compost metagenome]